MSYTEAPLFSEAKRFFLLKPSGQDKEEVAPWLVDADTGQVLDHANIALCGAHISTAALRELRSSQEPFEIEELEQHGFRYIP